ncbi:Histone H2B.11 [Platanthera zijinensis]|uniref:Histone H2B.11 n=1 Tax=Platanthera zijinensis TaxID=2320716 RepID=A0AAP0B4C1_9ASPA
MIMSLKQIHPHIVISNKFMNILNSLANNLFEKLAQEASCLALDNKNPGIATREIQTAIHLILPDELAKLAVAKGNKVIAMLTSS